MVEVEPVFSSKFPQAVDTVSKALDALAECVGPHTTHPYYAKLKEPLPAVVSRSQTTRLGLALQKLYKRKYATVKKDLNKDDIKLLIAVIQDLGAICHSEARSKGASFYWISILGHS